MKYTDDHINKTINKTNVKKQEWSRNSKNPKMFQKFQKIPNIQKLSFKNSKKLMQNNTN